MTIEQKFLDFNGCKLYTTIMKHDILVNHKGYLVVNPFAEEKKSAHRILFEIANSIVEQGYFVLMFDFSGCGDSEGTLLTSSLDDWIAELNYVSDFFKTNYSLNEVNYLGLRLGAFVAGLNSDKEKLGSKIIMLEPIINPEEYFKKVLRSKLFKELLTQGNISSKRNKLIGDLNEDKSIDFDGHEIGSVFYKSIVRHKDDFKNLNLENTFIINISLTGKVSKEYQKLVEIGILKNENLKTIKLESFLNLA